MAFGDVLVTRICGVLFLLVVILGNTGLVQAVGEGGADCVAVLAGATELCAGAVAIGHAMDRLGNPDSPLSTFGHMVGGAVSSDACRTYDSDEELDNDILAALEGCLDKEGVPGSSDGSSSDDSDAPLPPRKKTRARRHTRLGPDGCTPLPSWTWMEMLGNPALKNESSRAASVFRNRFRAPYPVFEYLVKTFKDKNWLQTR